MVKRRMTRFRRQCKAVHLTSVWFGSRREQLFQPSTLNSHHSTNFRNTPTRGTGPFVTGIFSSGNGGVIEYFPGNGDRRIWLAMKLLISVTMSYG